MTVPMLSDMVVICCNWKPLSALPVYHIRIVGWSCVIVPVCCQVERPQRPSDGSPTFRGRPWNWRHDFEILNMSEVQNELPDTVYVYICTRPCHPPPPPPIWDGSHILVPYEIFPLPPLWCGGGVALSPSPPCGVVGVWYGMVGMYGVYGRSGMACLESMVCLVCMVCMAWVVGIVVVWYCMYAIVCMVGVVITFHMYGMYDMYDRYDRYGMHGIIDMYGRYGICSTQVVLSEYTGSK